jgi:hypothetical protein
MDDIEKYARLLGMKPHREVLEVREVEGGHAVRTHDGQWTLVRDSGVVSPIDGAYAAMLRGFHGEPEPVELTRALEDAVDLAEALTEQVVAKPVLPKRRGRA